MDKIEPTIVSLYSSGFGVVGQPNFTTSTPTTTQNGLYNPFGVSFDSSGNLWVVDYSNNRVLMFSPPFSNGMNASLVIGQANFTTSTLATTQNGLYSPQSISFDSSGNLWVSDYNNNRVLMFSPPFSNGMNASLVIGQANFTTSGYGTTQNSLSNPQIISFDSSGNLWVVDYNNARVLMFSPPFSNGMNASLVIGQANFTTSTLATTQNGLYGPFGVYSDLSDNLWVSDTTNNRVLMFSPPFSNGMNASLVIGQANFTTSTPTTTQNGLYSPHAVSFDSSGNLWVSDNYNNRVLMFYPPFSNGMNASLVIGQPNFTTTTRTTTQNGLYYPECISFDLSDNLWVIDGDNNRVLMFSPPFSNGMNAGSTTNSQYASVSYPLQNLFYTPKAGITKV